MATYPSWDKDAHWVRVYRARIRLGLEFCRDCLCENVWGTGQQLTLDHIHPRARGGPSLMENATILCADGNNRKGDGPARVSVSLAAEERAVPHRLRWSKHPVPAVPRGPWDEPGSHQPPRTPRGIRRAVEAQLPEWARPLFVEEFSGEIPEWVIGLVRSRYAQADRIPPHVLRLIEKS
jgi:HNH endonuclease